MALGPNPAVCFINNVLLAHSQPICLHSVCILSGGGYDRDLINTLQNLRCSPPSGTSDPGKGRTGRDRMWSHTSTSQSVVWSSGNTCRKCHFLGPAPDPDRHLWGQKTRESVF